MRELSKLVETWKMQIEIVEYHYGNLWLFETCATQKQVSSFLWCYPLRAMDDVL